MLPVDPGIFHDEPGKHLPFFDPFTEIGAIDSVEIGSKSEIRHDFPREDLRLGGCHEQPFPGLLQAHEKPL